MSVVEPPRCDICAKPKVQLKERLGQTKDPVFVCTSVTQTKVKMPCDGWIGKTAKLQL